MEVLFDIRNVANIINFYRWK